MQLSSECWISRNQWVKFDTDSVGVNALHSKLIGGARFVGLEEFNIVLAASLYMRGKVQ